jgi:hypothetical protein
MLLALGAGAFLVAMLLEAGLSLAARRGGEAVPLRGA